MHELSRAHENRVEELESGLRGIGINPTFAIGQRALLADRVLWDCITLLDDATAKRVGPVDAIAISHPHYYASMVERAERVDAHILLHEADREHVARPSDRIEFWTGERYRLAPTHELIRLEGHFAGGPVCLWNGALLAGDIVQVVPDPGWFSFMYSYPNLIPLPATEIERI